jgi:hypothetical protein
VESRDWFVLGMCAVIAMSVMRLTGSIAEPDPNKYGPLTPPAVSTVVP